LIFTHFSHHRDGITSWELSFMQDMSPTLQEAYDFINRGDLQSARELLQPQIDNNTSNPDVWWLYAHATDDPQAGREALMKVVSLNPTYPGATDLIKQHDEKTGDSASLRTKETSKSEKSPKKRRRLLPMLFIIIILLAFLALVFVLSNNQSTPSPTPTAVAQSTTDGASPNMTADAQSVNNETEVPTIAPPTETPDTPIETPIADPLSLLEEDLSQFTLASDEPIAAITSTMGETLRVSVCAPQTTSGRQVLLSDVMQELTNYLDLMPDATEAIAVALTDCDTNRIIRIVGAPISTASAFVANEILLRDFQASWMPVE
jgi:hypothetical protein